MDKVFDAYCGLFCRACPIFISTLESGNDEMTAGSSTSYEERACSGCKSGQVAIWCRDCAIKNCARGKGFDNCGECSEYPCQEINQFVDDADWPYHKETPEYIRDIKEQGKEFWIEKVTRRWSCEKCGSIYSWFSLECSKCGSPVNGYKNPNQE
jgi:hypothetical protein